MYSFTHRTTSPFLFPLVYHFLYVLQKFVTQQAAGNYTLSLIKYHVSSCFCNCILFYDLFSSYLLKFSYHILLFFTITFYLYHQLSSTFNPYIRSQNPLLPLNNLSNHSHPTFIPPLNLTSKSCLKTATFYTVYNNFHH